MDKLKGKKVAILVADGFEQSEMVGPKQALEAEGAEVHIVSPNENNVKGWHHTDWGDKFQVDVLLSDAKADSYDGLVLPGGQMNPDLLRIEPQAISLIREFAVQQKPIAAICHGPWTLIEADLVVGKTMTSYPSIRTDMVNAGVNWVDKEVVVDGQFITSRNPDDIPAFSNKIIEALASKEVHA